MSNWRVRGGRQAEMRGWQTGQITLELDLNIPPLEESSGLPASQRLIATNNGNHSLQVQGDDNDVAFISLREYEHAMMNKTRRYDFRSNRTQQMNEAARTEVIQVLTEAAETTTNNSGMSLGLNGQEMRTSSGSRSPPPEEELKFACSICLDPMTEETSTKCGHIFCKECIVAVVKSQHKCPTCRRKLRRSELHRVFLPSATYS